MERVVSCYLPPSCYSPPLSKLSVGSWASIPFHLLKPGSQPWTSTDLMSTSSIQSFTAAFQHLGHNSWTDFIWEYLASSSPDSAWGEKQQQLKGSQLPLFSVHMLYAEILFARVSRPRKKKSFLQDAGKENCSLYQHVGTEFFFPPSSSHQQFYIGNSPRSRMLARLTQATRILKLPFFKFAWQ